MSRIVFRKQARAEFDEAGDWYEREHRGLGLEFMAEIDRVRASSTGNDAKKVLGGAVAGAIIGQVIGKDRKGTLIGAAAGAAAGAGAAAVTADFDGCVDTGSAISIRLTNALTVAAAE